VFDAYETMLGEQCNHSEVPALIAVLCRDEAIGFAGADDSRAYSVALTAYYQRPSQRAEATLMYAS